MLVIKDGENCRLKFVLDLVLILYPEIKYVFICREACINFKELCNKKRGDGLWMEELAAMEACPPSELSFLGSSGIILNNDGGSLNPNIVLTLPKGDVMQNGSTDASRSDSTASHASFDSKKGTVYSFYILQVLCA